MTEESETFEEFVARLKATQAKLHPFSDGWYNIDYVLRHVGKAYNYGVRDGILREREAKQG